MIRSVLLVSMWLYICVDAVPSHVGCLLDAEPLYVHLTSQGVDFLQMSFRWMNCLLMRYVGRDVGSLLTVLQSGSKSRCHLQRLESLPLAQELLMSAADMKEIQSSVKMCLTVSAYTVRSSRVFRYLLCKYASVKLEVSDTPCHLRGFLPA